MAAHYTKNAPEPHAHFTLHPIVPHLDTLSIPFDSSNIIHREHASTNLYITHDASHRRHLKTTAT